MKTKSGSGAPDDLRPEYDLHSLLRRGVRGKYVQRYLQGTNLVLLAPDVARAFPDGTAVNEALRLVIRLRKLPGATRKTAKA